MPRIASAMKPLYDRLKAEGLDRPFIQSAILPDWWDDELYAQDSNRLLAQMSIAQFLDVRLQQVAREDAPIGPAIHNVRLKRGRNAEINEVAGAVAAAVHAAKVTARLMNDRLPFTGLRPALEIRNQLLSRPDCAWPDLERLVDYCWEHGIGVIHVTRLPKVAGSKKIAGLATFSGNRPVIVLCSGRDSPSWLAFHLAHELGHIMSGHVVPGGEPIVDLKIEGLIDEEQEREADQYAFQVMTGEPNPQLAGSRMTGPQLALAARSYGEKHRIDPGTVALIFGYCQGRMPVAQAALRALGAGSGGRAILAEAFRRHVPLDDIPEGIQRSLSATTQIFGLTSIQDSND